VAARWRADRSAWIPAALVVVVLAIVGALAFQGRDRGADTVAPDASADGADEFVIEGEDGTLVFDRDGDDASLEFEGPEGSGRYSFDLDGDGVVAEGEDGAFELTGEEPPGWPADFPRPDGAVVVRGSVLGADALTQLSTTYVVDGLPGEVVDFYVDALAGQSPIVDQEPGSPITTISFEGDWHGYLTTGPGEGGTTLSVQLYVEGGGEPDPTDG
jgi:hypothetical protein